METEKIELKPCPFCGGEMRMCQSNIGGAQILCAECGCGTQYSYKKLEHAIAAWNRRTPSDHIVAANKKADDNLTMTMNQELSAYRALGNIDGLTAIVKAINEGRVVVLPCKVWETVHKAIKGTPLCSVEDSEKSSFLHAKKPPVLHAHWTDKGSLSCRCSHCGCKASDEFPYCPRCYARMDEQTKN